MSLYSISSLHKHQYTAYHRPKCHHVAHNTCLYIYILVTGSPMQPRLASNLRYVSPSQVLELQIGGIVTIMLSEKIQSRKIM